jgi:hypothetical protein
MAAITRRDLGLGALTSFAALATARFVAPAYGAEAVDLEAFTTLSRELTGTSALDPGVAAKLLEGLIASGNGVGLADLVAGTAPRAGKGASLADAIVGSWYSGVYDTGHGPAVATYDQALMWNALTFTKPAGQCGGETGYWADPPQS